MTEHSHAPRINSYVRGGAIVFIALVYAFITKQPGASFTVSLLIAAGLQLAVLLLRRFVPPAQLPQMMNLVELLADAATVLLFALGVYGGIANFGYDV
jgi:hypothetical protein